eukprot:3896809-Lingulodinium_polyedra.AAC.1
MSSGKCVTLAEWTHWPLTRWRATCTKWPGESRSTVSLTCTHELSCVAALKLDCMAPLVFSGATIQSQMQIFV